MFTRHAQTRCQQRGVRGDVIDAILAYGCRRHRYGADVYFMDHKAKARARAELGGQYAKVSDRLDTYLVMSDGGEMITAAKRLGRLKF
ncbi:hypothetical protein [Mesorhizobium sp. WSM3873]|uniref:hypothetical protein n=1 Tax=Mesorhizobium sp. WSM3873 TaxID=1854056 RepID=UPI0007FEDBA9|nr:hypothetical protein [Mesorhizobium sp. WSM3873]OBQ82995.1 hypothetical protein A9K71_25805 [Mesorhizobium sp. WSM3873]